MKCSSATRRFRLGKNESLFTKARRKHMKSRTSIYMAARPRSPHGKPITNECIRSFAAALIRKLAHDGCNGVYWYSTMMELLCSSWTNNMVRPSRVAARLFVDHITTSCFRGSTGVDVLQLSELPAGNVKESRNGNPTRDLQMAADRTRHHSLCGTVVSSLFSVVARY